MPKQSYRIVMKTSIGERYGTMTVERKGEQVSGFMDILGHTEAFHGKVDETGNCYIEGQLISLTRTIPYIAVGRISPTMLQLSLHEERNIFEVAGVPYKENGRKKCEKIL